MAKLICAEICWTPTYIVSQLFVVLGLVSLAITYFLHNKKLILTFSMLNAIFYCLQYILLGAYTGALVNFLGAIRGVVFYVEEHKGKNKSLFTLLMFVVILTVCAIFTWQGPASLLTITAGLTFTYSVWQDNIHVYRWLSLVVNSASIAYNLIYHSLFAVIAESIFLVVAIIGIIKLYVKIKQPKQDTVLKTQEQN